jgi:hypothetical protein
VLVLVVSYGQTTSVYRFLFTEVFLVSLGFIDLYGLQNEVGSKHKIIRWLYAILVIELLSGVLLAHFDMIGLVQNAHLLFATILFGILFMMIFRAKLLSKN